MRAAALDPSATADAVTADPTRSRFFSAAADRLDFYAWRRTNRLGEELLVQNYVLPEEQLPGWALDRVDVVTRPGWPRSLQCVWRDAAAGLTLVDVYESASREQAHALLVELVARVESPLVARQERPTLGDVVFTGPGEGFILFARANLVLAVRAASPRPTGIPEAAARIDADVISKPSVSPVEALPAIRSLRATAPAVRAGERVALTLEAAETAGEPLVYKFFTPTGELSLEDDQVVYRHGAGGPAQVETYAIAAGRGASRRVLRLDSL